MNDTPKRTDLTTSNKQLPAAPPRGGGSLMDQALNRMPAEQQDAFMQKVLEKRLDIEVQAAQAEQGYTDFEQESNQTVRQVRELSKTGMDVTATYQGRTASGSWNVEVRKSNYTLYIAIAAIIGIIALIIVLRM
jgi:hypothetical protein